MLVFEEACATEMAQAFRQRVLVVKDFIPDVSADIRAAVGDWTGESRQACDGALKRLEKRGEELADVLTAAAEAMEKILAEVDVEAMSSFVQSLSSFEEAAKE